MVQVDDDLKTISDRVHEKHNGIDASTSHEPDEENLHFNLISPQTFLLINVLTGNEKCMYRFVAVVVDEDGEMKFSFLGCHSV